ncbi:hypothetical protein RHSIM_Rhsim02G0093000 [Rhododendron simsii]|uniref:Uncharacterized protein n=1 Tax=Rhododendron simsii TaxID=118357 RepID=A0A834LWN9_RHOSS|nr:hypothetical protein RHSIM_Rhsim02G0093000 [Rhododendron simsii]
MVEHSNRLYRKLVLNWIQRISCWIEEPRMVKSVVAREPNHNGNECGVNKSDNFYQNMKSDLDPTIKLLEATVTANRLDMESLNSKLEELHCCIVTAGLF